MKEIIKSALPFWLLRAIRQSKQLPKLVSSYAYDFRRYLRLSSIAEYRDNENKLRAIITATYHNIEKGLSLPEPRLGFGRANLSKLVGYLDEFIENYGPREFLAAPLDAIEAYLVFNESHGVQDLVLRATLARLRLANLAHTASECGGVMRVTRAEIACKAEQVTEDFFTSRYSCRQFTSEPLTREQIETAVRVAQKTPVVCNRQSGRVHVFSERQQIDRILEVHAGARGFSSSVSALFCLSVDMSNFHGVGERYQGWIDGGMFAMSFIYGLHMQAIGSCCLNWSKDPQQDKQMRALLKLPENEMIVVFVAAGHLPSDLNVARSIRKPMQEVLEFH